LHRLRSHRVSTYFCAPPLPARTTGLCKASELFQQRPGTCQRLVRSYGNHQACLRASILAAWQPCCPWQPLPLPLSSEGSGAKSASQTTGASRKGYTTLSLRLIRNFGNQSAVGVFLSIERKALTPYSAPTAGSQGKTDHTPSVWLWQVEPWNQTSHVCWTSLGPGGMFLSAGNAEAAPDWSGFCRMASQRPP
jgi:hypothetical protein